MVAAALSPYETWLLACETRDGVRMVDPESRELLNPAVGTLSPAAAEAAVQVAWARWALSDPGRPLVMRRKAARILGEAMPTAADLTDAERDRQGI